MNMVLMFSAIAILVFSLPLWFDANKRPEFGKRPGLLLIALILYTIANAALIGASFGTGERAVMFGLPVIMLAGLIMFLAFFMLEFSVHLQRITKSHLTDTFKSRLPLLYLLLAATVAVVVGGWVLFHVLTGISLVAFFTAGPNELETMLAAVQGVNNWLSLIALAFSGLLVTLYIYTTMVFTLQEKVIRLKRYPFFIGAGFTGVVFLSGLLRGWSTSGSFLISLFILLNILFVIRLYHEYFFFRMHHLSDLHFRQQELEKARTLLINKVLKSDQVDDEQIINETMTNFLERLQKSMPNQLHAFKSMMVYRRIGKILRVDSDKNIIKYCTPIQELEAVKRMSPADLRSHIMAQVVEIDTIIQDTIDPKADLITRAFHEAYKKKEQYLLEPIPASLKGIHKAIVIYPVFNRDEIIGMLVMFKDGFSQIFPQEHVVIKSLVDNLSIIFTIMDGKSVQEEKNRLTGEMNLAKTIQTSILPKQITIPGYEVGATMQTASEVGGDLYDYYPAKYGNFVNIGDVSGHGLPAGMMALIQMTAFQSAVLTSEILGKPMKVSTVYDVINMVLCAINRDRIGSDKFMTCNILLEKDGVFQHAGAHLTALIYRSAEDKVVEQPGMMDRTAFLGLSEYIKSETSEGSFNLNSGDMLILYTDGAIEARDRNDRLFGIENLTDIITRNAKETPDRLIQMIMERLRDFAQSGDFKTHGGNFADDISLVILRKI